MEFTTNIEMISVCGTDGRMQPIRFRFEDREQCLRRVHVLEVLTCKEVKYLNVEAFDYLCRTRTEDREELMRVRYTVRTHQWVLFTGAPPRFRPRND